MLKTIWGTAMTVAGLLAAIAALAPPESYRKLIPCFMVLVVIGGLGYIAAEWRERCEARRNKVLDIFFENVKTSSGGIHLLINCRFYELKTERELERVCWEIEKRRGQHPFGQWEALIPKGKRLLALKCMHDNGLDMFSAAPVWPFFEDDPDNALAKFIPPPKSSN